MNQDGFRKLALALPGAIESAHMGHPDFRAGGRIFASLGAPDASFGMVKLTPEQQDGFVDFAPAVFVPVAGGWGRGGATNVRLAAATAATLRPALEVAWRNVVPAKLAAALADAATGTGGITSPRTPAPNTSPRTPAAKSLPRKPAAKSPPRKPTANRARAASSLRPSRPGAKKPRVEKRSRRS